MLNKQYYVIDSNNLDVLIQQIANAVNNNYSKREVVENIKTTIEGISTSLDDIRSEFIPTGTIIDVLGSKNIPSGYVKCDGTIYSISYRKGLADYIKSEFGSYDFFGGNGTSTFAVPIIENEDRTITKCIKV